MRSLRYARERARSCRQIIGTSADQLFERVVRHLSEVYEIELEPTTKAFLEGGRAEVSPAEGILFYDEQLDIDPYERLLVILHELGHLELHPRLRRSCSVPETLAGSMYLNDGAPSLARYNKHGREETEANSFAVEFICPANELFEKWGNERASTSASIAKALNLPIYLVQAQLAEALYEITLGQDEQEPKKPVNPDASQLEAAMYVDGPALVNAGPGTGKTATLVTRIEHLLEQLQLCLIQKRFPLSVLVSVVVKLIGQRQWRFSRNRCAARFKGRRYGVTKSRTIKCEFLAGTPYVEKVLQSGIEHSQLDHCFKLLCHHTLPRVALDMRSWKI